MTSQLLGSSLINGLIGDEFTNDDVTDFLEIVDSLDKGKLIGANRG
ncbi:MAG: hypothetical protein AAGA75_17015 [Cyanobacteria bacterium P01_E01_bin.6]